MGSANDDLLHSALSALGLPLAELVSAETRATDASVWQVRHDGRLLAIRVLREEQTSVMEIEHRSMDLVRSAGVPAPAIISTAMIDGRRPTMAIEWMAGESVGDVLLQKPHLARRLGAQAGNCLAKIHAIPDPVIPGSDNWIARGARNDPALVARLTRLSVRAGSLLHLDFHPFNLVAQGGRIVGVLDWTNSSVGDPRADIARALTILQVSAPLFIAEHGARRMTLGLFTRAFLQGYQRIVGSVEDLAPFMVWAGQWMLEDLGPILDQLPVANPQRLRDRIVQKTADWRARAHLS